MLWLRVGFYLTQISKVKFKGFLWILIFHSSMRFHLYAYDMTRQVEAHHYYTHYNEDMRKCLIYDTPDKDAWLIAIEYNVTKKLFKQLPDEEMQL